MEMVMSNGFCEMTQEDILCVDGGVKWGTVLTGAGIVVACAALTVATGGVGLCSVSLVLGAGTATEIAVCGAAAVGAAIGGAGIGYGATH